MQITDVMGGSEVTVEVMIQEQAVLLITKSLATRPDGILVDRIMIGDGELVWRRPAIINIINWQDHDTYIFNADSIEPVDSRYGRVHQIRCTEEGKKKFRRGAERMDVIKMGTCFAHGRSYKAIIYDISISGVSVILDGNVRMRIGDHVTVRFTMGAVDEFFHVFELDAEIVRFFDVKGRVAIGCKVADMPAELIGEVSKREMKRMMDKMEQEQQGNAGEFDMDVFSPMNTAADDPVSPDFDVRNLKFDI